MDSTDFPVPPLDYRTPAECTWFQNFDEEKSFSEIFPMRSKRKSRKQESKIKTIPISQPKLSPKTLSPTKVKRSPSKSSKSPSKSPRSPAISKPSSPMAVAKTPIKQSAVGDKKSPDYKPKDDKTVSRKKPEQASTESPVSSQNNGTVVLVQSNEKLIPSIAIPKLKGHKPDYSMPKTYSISNQNCSPPAVKKNILLKAKIMEFSSPQRKKMEDKKSRLPQLSPNK